jgi:tetratricopeptide (TPR) repeat protein
MEEDFEDWEFYYELMENQDWKGLLKWQKSNYEKSPTEHYALYYYGEALILNKQFDEAIVILKKALQTYPESSDISHSLLDALFENGQSENDIEWLNKPKILQLNRETILLCEKHLKNRPKERNVYNIYNSLLMTQSYLKFTELELFKYLCESDNFKTVGPQNGFPFEMEFENVKK